jgi:small subunit ribosomal protein S2
MQGLLEAGVHFGHQTRRWNPKMKPYIFTQRSGIYILDLKKTLIELENAYNFARTVGQRGGTVLFVGTKKQAQEPLLRAAQLSGMPYVTHRWLGGMLTNWDTVRSRVTYMEKLEGMIEDGTMATLPKKEQILLGKKLVKLQNNLNGIRDMKSMPQAVFVVDTKREINAVKEARRLNIPIIGMLDTNADPDEVDFPVPANDDAIRSISLVADVIASGILDGNGGASLGVVDEPSAPAASAPAEVVEADPVPTEEVAPVIEETVEDDAPVTDAPSVEETVVVVED